jgi:hypothetical protein
VRVQGNGKEKMCWALVDSGSNTTFVRRDVVDELGVEGTRHAFSVKTLGGTASHDELCVELTLASEDGTESVFVEDVLTVPSIPIRATYDGTSHCKWDHLRDLKIPKVDADVEIVIGTDCSEMFWVIEQRRAERKQPVARKTLLGWILLGPTSCENQEISANFQSTDTAQESLDRMLMADFEDVKRRDPVMSVDDKRALKIMEGSIKQVEGKFEVGIPWKVDPEEALQNNRAMAESRMRMLKRKFETNPKLASDYTKTVETYIADGHAEL